MSGLERASGLCAAALTDAKFDRNKKRECVTAAQLQVARKVKEAAFDCGRSKMEKYKKLREIGQGSFGRVALVQEKKGKGRKLVLKEVEIKRMAEGEQEKVTTDSFPTIFLSR